MFKLVIIALVAVIPRADCFLENVKEFFVYRDSSPSDGGDCPPLVSQQYYWQNNGSDNSSGAIKLDCLHKNFPTDKYFPKCCPPNYLYQRKSHRCIPSNTTNIYDIFGTENLLIRTDLSDCTVILDHILPMDGGGLTINADRSLYLDGSSYRLGSYCVENNLENDKELVIRTCEEANVCKSNNIRCIKKCCPDGQYYEGIKCQPGPHYGLSLENNSRFLDKNEHFDAVLISKPCQKYIGGPKYKYHIKEDGTVVVQELGVWKEYSIEENYYCMEYIQITRKHEILLCMASAEVTTDSGAKGVIMVISCVGLLLTLLGYFILPDLKNLIGNIVITYCSCLFVAFILLTYLQFDPNPGRLCVYFGFGIAFAFLTAFAWMTILSYEIWRVLGSIVVEYGQRLPGERGRYMQYNIFAWSVPTAIITMNFLDYTYNIFPAAIHLELGNERCVFENIRAKGTYGYIFHFVLPSGLLLFVNLIVFIKTIKYIFQVKNEIRQMKVLDSNFKQNRWRTFLDDKEKFVMVIRIFLLMGINWFFEMISSILNLQTNETLRIVETTFDMINALQGVFIFCIFMFKKKILKSLLKVLNINKNNRRSSVITCSTEVVMLPTSVRISR